MVLLYRFPIADLRKDPSKRLQWWKRNLRPEVLRLELSKLRVLTELGVAESAAQNVEIKCRSLRGACLLSTRAGVS